MKIYCTDSLKKMLKIEDSSIDAIISDPPYGVTDLLFDKQKIDWNLFWEQAERVCKSTANIVLFSQQPFTTDLINSNRKNFRYEIIWLKSSPTGFLNANKRPLRTHENILIFSRAKAKSTYNPQFTEGKPYVSAHNGKCKHYGGTERTITINTGYRYPKSVVTYQSGSARKETQHPSEKPLELMEFLVKTYTNEFDVVLDPFAGSGTTGVACLLNNREAVLIEQDPNYISECRSRIQKYKRLIQKSGT